MKKFVIWLVGIIGLIVVAALVIPFVVDMNQFKPHIKAAVSQNVNADIDFSSARLTILTGLGVRLADVSIKNTDSQFNGTTLFKVDEEIFRAELMPLLKKRFEGEILIKGPEFTIAQKGGKNNLASLAKPKDATSAPTEPEVKEEAKPLTQEEIAEREAMIEELKKNVVLKALKITEAAFFLKNLDNEKAKAPVSITNLDIIAEDIGLERDIKLSISTQTKVQEAGVSIEGPIEYKMTARINTQGSTFEKLTFNGSLSFDKLSINAMNAFVKKPGIPLNVQLTGNATGNTAQLEKLTFYK